MDSFFVPQEIVSRNSHRGEAMEMVQPNDPLQSGRTAAQNPNWPSSECLTPSVHSPHSYHYHFPIEPRFPTSVLSRRSRWLRITLFILLELSFTALAACCISRPLILPSNLAPQAWEAEVKGSFTILFIVWQALALFPVRGILSYIFGGEWVYQFSRTGALVPGKTDRVSTLTAGYWDQVCYFRDRTASWSFRVAFLTSLLFVALASLAPGAINVIVVFAPNTMMLEIGNLTIPYWNVFGFHFETWNPIERAWLITRLEQIEKSKFGYQNERNWLVAWPSLGLPANGSGAIEYPSDVVRFDFNCQWEVPVWSDSFYGIRGLNWSVWDNLGAPQPPHPLASKPNTLFAMLLLITPIVSNSANGTMEQ
jgi:hypothetical protein